ncbi:hypothetical protein COBT_001249, partial [Conglomerata obtusa]
MPIKYKKKEGINMPEKKVENDLLDDAQKLINEMCPKEKQFRNLPINNETKVFKENCSDDDMGKRKKEKKEKTRDNENKTQGKAQEKKTGLRFLDDSNCSEPEDPTPFMREGYEVIRVVDELNVVNHVRKSAVGYILDYNNKVVQYKLGISHKIYQDIIDRKIETRIVHMTTNEPIIGDYIVDASAVKHVDFPVLTDEILPNFSFKQSHTSKTSSKDEIEDKDKKIDAKLEENPSKLEDFNTRVFKQMTAQYNDMREKYRDKNNLEIANKKLAKFDSNNHIDNNHYRHTGNNSNKNFDIKNQRKLQNEKDIETYNKFIAYLNNKNNYQDFKNFKDNLRERNDNFEKFIVVMSGICVEQEKERTKERIYTEKKMKESVMIINDEKNCDCFSNDKNNSTSKILSENISTKKNEETEKNHRNLCDSQCICKFDTSILHKEKCDLEKEKIVKQSKIAEIKSKLFVQRKTHPVINRYFHDERIKSKDSIFNLNLTRKIKNPNFDIKLDKFEADANMCCKNQLDNSSKAKKAVKVVTNEEIQNQKNQVIKTEPKPVDKLITKTCHKYNDPESEYKNICEVCLEKNESKRCSKTLEDIQEIVNVDNDSNNIKLQDKKIDLTNKNSKQKFEHNKEIDSALCDHERTNVFVEDKASTIELQPEEDNRHQEYGLKNKYARYNTVIGHGSSKLVYKGIDLTNNKEIAWNVIELKNYLLRDVLFEEIDAIKRIDHPKILNHIDYWFQGSKCIIITELMVNGTLEQYLDETKKNIDLIRNYGLQIVEAVKHLHSLKLAHRDLKSENIFIGKDNNKIVVGDLGITRKCTPRRYTFVGTPEFLAREVYVGNGYGKAIDVYAFGMVLLEMATAVYPYSECKSSGDVFKKVVSGIPPNDIYKVQNACLRKLIVKCIAPENERINIEDIENDHFFTQNYFDPLLAQFYKYKIGGGEMMANAFDLSITDLESKYLLQMPKEGCRKCIEYFNTYYYINNSKMNDMTLSIVTVKFYAVVLQIFFPYENKFMQFTYDVRKDSVNSIVDEMIAKKAFLAKTRDWMRSFMNNGLKKIKETLKIRGGLSKVMRKWIMSDSNNVCFEGSDSNDASSIIHNKDLLIKRGNRTKEQTFDLNIKKSIVNKSLNDDQKIIERCSSNNNFNDNKTKENIKDFKLLKNIGVAKKDKPRNKFEKISVNDCQNTYEEDFNDQELTSTHNKFEKIDINHSKNANGEENNPQELSNKLKILENTMSNENERTYPNHGLINERAIAKNFGNNDADLTCTENTIIRQQELRFKVKSDKIIKQDSDQTTQKQHRQNECNEHASSTNEYEINIEHHKCDLCNDKILEKPIVKDKMKESTILPNEAELKLYETNSIQIECTKNHREDNSFLNDKFICIDDNKSSKINSSLKEKDNLADEEIDTVNFRCEHNQYNTKDTKSNINNFVQEIDEKTTRAQIYNLKYNNKEQNSINNINCSCNNDEKLFQKLEQKNKENNGHENISNSCACHEIKDVVKNLPLSGDNYMHSNTDTSCKIVIKNQDDTQNTCRTCNSIKNVTDTSDFGSVSIDANHMDIVNVMSNNFCECKKCNLTKMEANRNKNELNKISLPIVNKNVKNVTITDKKFMNNMQNTEIDDIKKYEHRLTRSNGNLMNTKKSEDVICYACNDMTIGVNEPNKGISTGIKLNNHQINDMKNNKHENEKDILDCKICITETIDKAANLCECQKCTLKSLAHNILNIKQQSFNKCNCEQLQKENNQSSIIQNFNTKKGLDSKAIIKCNEQALNMTCGESLKNKNLDQVFSNIDIKQHICENTLKNIYETDCIAENPMGTQLNVKNNCCGKKQIEIEAQNSLSHQETNLTDNGQYSSQIKPIICINQCVSDNLSFDQAKFDLNLKSKIDTINKSEVEQSYKCDQNKLKCKCVALTNEQHVNQNFKHTQIQNILEESAEKNSFHINNDTRQEKQLKQIPSLSKSNTSLNNEMLAVKPINIKQENTNAFGNNQSHNSMHNNNHNPKTYKLYSLPEPTNDVISESFSVLNKSSIHGYTIDDFASHKYNSIEKHQFEQELVALKDNLCKCKNYQNHFDSLDKISDFKPYQNNNDEINKNFNRKNFKSIKYDNDNNDQSIAINKDEALHEENNSILSMSKNINCKFTKVEYNDASNICHSCNENISTNHFKNRSNTNQDQASTMVENYNINNTESSKLSDKNLILDCNKNSTYINCNQNSCGKHMTQNQCINAYNGNNNMREKFSNNECKYNLLQKNSKNHELISCDKDNATKRYKDANNLIISENNNIASQAIKIISTQIKNKNILDDNKDCGNNKLSNDSVLNKNDYNTESRNINTEHCCLIEFNQKTNNDINKPCIRNQNIQHKCIHRNIVDNLEINNKNEIIKNDCNQHKNYIEPEIKNTCCSQKSPLVSINNQDSNVFERNNECLNYTTLTHLYQKNLDNKTNETNYNKECTKHDITTSDIDSKLLNEIKTVNCVDDRCINKSCKQESVKFCNNTPDDQFEACNNENINNEIISNELSNNLTQCKKPFVTNTNNLNASIKDSNNSILHFEECKYNSNMKNDIGSQNHINNSFVKSETGNINTDSHNDKDIKIKPDSINEERSNFINLANKQDQMGINNQKQMDLNEQDTKKDLKIMEVNVNDLTNIRNEMNLNNHVNNQQKTNLNDKNLVINLSEAVENNIERVLTPNLSEVDFPNKHFLNELPIEDFIKEAAIITKRDIETAQGWIKIIKDQEITCVGDLRVLTDEDWYKLNTKYGLTIFSSRAMKNMLYGKDEHPQKEKELSINTFLHLNESMCIKDFINQVCLLIKKEKSNVWITRILKQDIRTVGELKCLTEDDWERLDL